MTIKDSLNVDEDLERVNDLYKELKIHRRKRNYQHKRMRGLKAQRDAFSKEVMLLVIEIQKIKKDRDEFNEMVNEFKQLRDEAVAGRDAALNSGDEALAKKLDKKQEKYHAKMMDKAQESQEYQQKIEDLNIVFAKIFIALLAITLILFLLSFPPGIEGFNKEPEKYAISCPL